MSKKPKDLVDTPKSRRGRPSLGHDAPWNPDTFWALYAPTCRTLGEVSRRTGIPLHRIQKWQSDRYQAKPTLDERKALATFFSEVTGSRITHLDLGRPVERISYRFAK